MFGSKEDIKYMFKEMIQRSEQLFMSFASTTMDENLFHLPNFVEALSSITKEIEEV